MDKHPHCIVAAARGWIGTRFHHQGRLKRTATHTGGCDCLGLLTGVARELNLKRVINGQEQFLASFDTTVYSHTPDGAALKASLAHLMDEVPVDQASPGDIALFEIDRNPQHLAIISDYQKGLGMIHAYAPARAVVEHGFDPMWRERIVAAYRF